MVSGTPGHIPTGKGGANEDDDDEMICRTTSVTAYDAKMKQGGIAVHEEKETSTFAVFGFACLAAFFGVVDGLSLGAVIFPPGTSDTYVNIGLSIGLLATLCANIFLLVSQFPFAVGGATIPQVAVIATYLASFGPDNPECIMVALPLVTFITGILIFLMGYVSIIQTLVKMTPACVFGGFLAGTGAIMWQYGLALMDPDFETFISGGDKGVVGLFQGSNWDLWVPGALVGMECFAVQKWVLPMKCFNTTEGTWSHSIVQVVKDYTMPVHLLIMTIVFYVWLFGSGGDLTSAREAGFIFNQTFPTNGPVFYEVWTMQDFKAVDWSLIFSGSLVTAVLQSFSLGFLTVVKNMYGTMERTGTHIDINQEIKLAGIQNMACGACGSMPGCLIMSYACTIHKLGVRSGRKFLIFQVILTTLAFVFGAYLIALIPKCLPGMILIWLGFWLMIEWVWDLVGLVPNIELAIVYAMIVMDIVIGDTYMLLVGLFVTLIITIQKFVTMETFKRQHAEDPYIGFEYKTHVNRSGGERKVIKDKKNEVLIMKLTTGVVSFHNAFLLVDHIDARLRQIKEKNENTGDAEPLQLRFVVIDMGAMVGFDVTALQHFKEISARGTDKGFHCLWVNAQMEFRRAYADYAGTKSICGVDAKLELHQLKKDDDKPIVSFLEVPEVPESYQAGNVTDQTATETTSLATTATTMEMYGDAFEKTDRSLQPGERVIFVNDSSLHFSEKPTELTIPGMSLALEFVEATLIAYNDNCARRAADSDVRAVTTDSGSYNMHLSETRKEIVEAFKTKGKKSWLESDKGEQILKVLITMHGNLNKYFEEYDVADLVTLATEYLSLHSCTKEETIYTCSSEDITCTSGDTEKWHIASSGKNCTKCPPIMWVTQGVVVHHFNGSDEHKGFSHADGIASSYHLASNGSIEKACVSSKAAESSPPMQTTAGFLGAMVHLGSIVALEKSEVVTLTREKFSTMQLTPKHAHIADMLLVYLARCRFIELSVKHYTSPKLLM